MISVKTSFGRFSRLGSAEDSSGLTTVEAVASDEDMLQASSQTLYVLMTMNGLIVTS